MQDFVCCCVCEVMELSCSSLFEGGCRLILFLEVKRLICSIKNRNYLRVTRTVLHPLLCLSLLVNMRGLVKKNLPGSFNIYIT